ncbi:MAG TPA: PLP-dependent transferase [Verrucomicrobiales bacterium]|nr:PLP-dependent transferase [Verrucomicrobiales bacterium]
MRDLLRDPLCKPEDLGKPIPDSPHAVSVCMPTWDSVIAYEEERPEVLATLACGYPRFVLHPTVARLFAAAEERFARDGERCLVFPSPAAARRCLRFVGLADSGIEAVHDVGFARLTAVSLPSSLFRDAFHFWRISGEIVSSRLARAALEEQRLPAGHETAAGVFIRRLAGWIDCDPGDVFLFPSGMNAVYALHRFLLHTGRSGPTVQLGFPYVDTLEIQRRFSREVQFLADPGPASLDRLRAVLEAGPVAGIFCETPSNPLLDTIDLETAAQLARRHGVPLFVDDTIATVYNVDVMPWADAISTSLTKNISGRGDVMAGSIAVSSASHFAVALRDFLRHRDDGELWPEDAAVLEENSRNFPERMERINRNTSALLHHLERRPQVAALYHPSLRCPEAYARLRRPGRGGGGLFSMILNEGALRAPRFYDALAVNKGPSLGTDYTLCCPYTLLAHYRELNWAAQHGVPAHLLRVAVGLEDPTGLAERFDAAFRAAESV